MRWTNGFTCELYNIRGNLFLVVDIRMIYFTFVLIWNKFYLSAIIVSISYHSTIYRFKAIYHACNITFFNIICWKNILTSFKVGSYITQRNLFFLIIYWLIWQKCAYFIGVFSYVTKMCLKSPIPLLFLRRMGLYKVLDEDLSSFHTDPLV